MKLRHLLIILFALLTALSTAEIAMGIAPWIGLGSVRLGLSGLVAIVTFAAVLLFLYRK